MYNIETCKEYEANDDMVPRLSLNFESLENCVLSKHILLKRGITQLLQKKINLTQEKIFKQKKNPLKTIARHTI